jgi:hypothetical protein
MWCGPIEGQERTRRKETGQHHRHDCSDPITSSALAPDRTPCTCTLLHPAAQMLMATSTMEDDRCALS